MVNKDLATLMNELNAIMDDSFYNTIGVYANIKMNTKRFKNFDNNGEVVFKNEEDEEYTLANPYLVEIFGIKQLQFVSPKSGKMAQSHCLLSSYGATLEEAIEGALNRYQVLKGDYSNKDYATTLYNRSVNRGYEGTFEDWKKDMEQLNADRISGAYFIERPVFDEDGNKIKEGVYKRYPRGINKKQDKADDLKAYQQSQEEE